MSAPDGALLLTRRDVAQLLAEDDWLAAAEEAFRAAAEGRALAPAPLHVAGIGGAFHAKGARLQQDRCYVAVKLNGNFPDNRRRGLPTVQGAILLCDGQTGALLAILDSIEVTLRRTAAASALAARHLARPHAATVLVCGCGAQGPAQLAALRRVLPLRRLLAWDRDPQRAVALAAAAPELAARACTDLAAAAGEADIIIACTTAHTAYLDAGMVRPGTFIAAVGADSPDKSELTPALMAAARVVVDDLDQCATMGDLGHALAAGAMRRSDVHASLAEIVVGRRQGRTGDDETIIFDSTGTAIQDVAAAGLIYRKALARPGGASVYLAA